MMEGQSTPSEFRHRVRGMLVGAAVGDALGWPQELRSGITGGQRSRKSKPEARFSGWTRNGGTQYARFLDPVRAGEYSDDTQLLLAVARSCIVGGGWWEHLTEVELPTWVSYQRGGGRAVNLASKAWAEKSPPWTAKAGSRAARSRNASAYFRAGANGVAMRIAPHAVVSSTDGASHDLITRVIRDGIATHGHPRALLGAAIHALVLRRTLMRQGTLEYGDLISSLIEDTSWQNLMPEESLPSEWLRTFEMVVGTPVNDVWSETQRELRDLLEIVRGQIDRGSLAGDEETLERLGCFDKSRNGSGTITAVAALYLATRAAPRPITGLLRAAFLTKADTDTLASMASTILGALHGSDWLGALADNVQDRDYLNNIAVSLAELALSSRRKTDEPQFQLSSPQRNLRVTRRILDSFSKHLENEEETASGVFPDGRKYEVVERERLEGRGLTEANRWRLKLEDGQTVLVDRIHRPPKRASVTKPRQVATGAQSNASPRITSETGGNDTKAPKARVIGISLGAHDLPQLAEFYRRVVGLSVEGIGDGRIRVGSVIEFRKSEGGTPKENPPLVIFVASGKSEEIAGRARSQNVEVFDLVDKGLREFGLRDPEGNEIQIREA